MTLRELAKIIVELNASDLHLSAGVPPVVRIDGKLQRLEGHEPWTPADIEETAMEFLGERHIEILGKKGETDLSYSEVGVGRFRVNVFKQRGSYCVAMRVVGLKSPTIDELGLPLAVKEFANKKRGLVLVTGPAGSGKTSTLASIVDEINTARSCHILTLEDPIEYLHKHKNSIVNQREIGIDSNTYSNALRSALRQDPDVILIGEMRDLETISTALTAAETGHLVLSTLHTMDAVSTIERIVDVFPPSQQNQVKVQLASVLQGVVSQQLVNRADGEGRVVATEIMACNAAIRNHIREGRYHQILSAMQTGAEQNMHTMDSSLARLCREGIISYDEAIGSAFDKEGITSYI